jgi:hypothetical protein
VPTFSVSPAVNVPVIAPMAIVPIVYSFVRYKQLERLGQL